MYCEKLTVGKLKEILNFFSEEDIVCLYSDSEGNEMSTVLGYYKEVIGQKYKQGKYTFIGGENVFGIDKEKDKGKTILFLQPSL